MSPRPLARRHRGALPSILLLAVAVPALLSGCRLAAAEPSPTPADFAGVRRVLAVGGIATEGTVSGDPGCADRKLARAAISTQASGLDQATPVTLHIYKFDDEEALQRNLGAVATCATSFVTDPASFVQIVAGPFVVTGQGPWGEEFTRILTERLQAATTGG